jgi:hypothetical protein
MATTYYADLGKAGTGDGSIGNQWGRSQWYGIDPGAGNRDTLKIKGYYDYGGVTGATTMIVGAGGNAWYIIDSQDSLVPFRINYFGTLDLQYSYIHNAILYCGNIIGYVFEDCFLADVGITGNFITFHSEVFTDYTVSYRTVFYLMSGGTLTLRADSASRLYVSSIFGFGGHLLTTRGSISDCVSNGTTLGDISDGTWTDSGCTYGVENTCYPSDITDAVLTNFGLGYSDTYTPAWAHVSIPPSIYQITRDDYFDRSQPSKSEELKNFVRVPITALTIQDASSEIYRSDPAIIVPANGTITIDADYSNYPASDPSGELEDVGAGISIMSEDYYACSARVVFVNSSVVDATVVLVISGIAYDVKSDEFVEDSNAASMLENGKCKYEFPVNHLLQTRTIGAAIAAKLLATYMTWRKDTNVTWRGDPALELGDIVEVPQYQYPHQPPYTGTHKGKNCIDSEGLFYIFKNKLSFDGTLKAVTDGRKCL